MILPSYNRPDARAQRMSSTISACILSVDSARFMPALHKARAQAIWPCIPMRPFQARPHLQVRCHAKTGVML